MPKAEPTAKSQQPMAVRHDDIAGRLRILPATTGDAALIKAILDDVLRWLAARGMRQWTRPFSDGWIAAKFAAGEFHIARLISEPVAVVRLQWSDPVFWGERDRDDAACVHTLAVRRNRAGERIGAAVVNWAEDQARVQKRQLLRLDCGAENRGLDAYYEGLGLVAVEPAMIGGQPVMLFEKDLAGDR